MQVGTTAPGECSCAGQVGRLAFYPLCAPLGNEISGGGGASLRKKEEVTANAERELDEEKRR